MKNCLFTKEKKMCLYNREMWNMIRKFAVYYHHCRRIHSNEFHVLAEMTMDAAVETDEEGAKIIKEIFRNIRMGNKFIKALDLFIDRIDKIKIVENETSNSRTQLFSLAR